MEWSKPGEDLGEPGVEDRKGSLLVHHSLVQVQPLLDVDVEGEETPQRQTLLDEVIHRQLGHLQGHQNRTPSRVLVSAPS